MDSKKVILEMLDSLGAVSIKRDLSEDELLQCAAGEVMLLMSAAGATSVQTKSRALELKEAK